MKFDDKYEYRMVSGFLDILQRMGLETGGVYRRFWTDPMTDSGEVVNWGIYPYNKGD
jgi:hypothetical protein